MMSLLRIVVYAESASRWTAQAIECDLMASGATRHAALDTLLKLVEVHVAFDGRQGTDPLSRFAPAPRAVLGEIRDRCRGSGAARADPVRSAY